MTVGGNQLEGLILHHHQQAVQVIADVLLRHRVLHQPEQPPQRLLRQRKAGRFAGRLGQTRKILGRQRPAARNGSCPP
jgi:hypothetical protein